MELRSSFTQRYVETLTYGILEDVKIEYTPQIINFYNDLLGIEKCRWQLSNNKDILIIRRKQV